MQFIDLGFLFLLLPVSAALYYCVPSRYRPAVLLALSVGFYYLMQPDFIWLPLIALPDCLLLAHMSRSAPECPKIELLIRLCVLKNLIVMLLFGILTPIMRQTAGPAGVMVVALSLIDLLVLQQRGAVKIASPVKAAAGTLFFARLNYGPVGAAHELVAQLDTPAPALPRIAKGVMLLITGVAKQVVLSEQFYALLKTISRLPPDRFSIALGWLCALCSALGLYFSLSAVSNIARGIGNIFSLKLPRMLYYPFQARSIREYVYRLNMPLEDTIFRLIFPQNNRNANDGRAYLISFFMPLALGLWLSPSGGFLLWGGYLGCLVLLDFLALRRIPVLWGFAARIVTFVITLPAYVLMLPTTLGTRFAMITAMVGLGSAPLINDAVIYLFTSNFILILVGVLSCSNIFDLLGRATEQQFPRLWWVCASLAHLALLVIATSFLLWNVR